MRGSTPKTRHSTAIAVGCAAQIWLAAATGVHGLCCLAAIVVRDSASANIECVTLLVMSACDYCVCRTHSCYCLSLDHDLPSEKLAVISCVE